MVTETIDGASFLHTSRRGGELKVELDEALRHALKPVNMNHRRFRRLSLWFVLQGNTVTGLSHVGGSA
jgi:hypothetical protein